MSYDESIDFLSALLLEPAFNALLAGAIRAARYAASKDPHKAPRIREACEKVIDRHSELLQELKKRGD